MAKLILASTIALSAVSSAFAHTFITRVIYNGVSSTNNLRTMPDSSVRNAPLKDLASQDFVCNTKRPGPAASQVTVAAGTSVKFHYVHENDVTPTSNDDIIGGFASHKGPCAVYAAPLDSVAYDGSTNWVKIWEFGWSAADGWCTDLIAKGGGDLSVPIPAGLPAGKWTFRTEFLALHESYAYPGSQWYVQCFDFIVTSSSTGTGSPTTKIPGNMKSTDPGVTVNIYGGDGKMCGTPGAANQDCSFYVIPGPKVATFSGSSGSSGSAATTAARTTTTSAAAPKTTSNAPAATTKASNAPAATTKTTTSVVRAPATTSVVRAPASSVAAVASSRTVSRATSGATPTARTRYGGNHHHRSNGYRGHH